MMPKFTVVVMELHTCHAQTELVTANNELEAGAIALNRLVAEEESATGIADEERQILATFKGHHKNLAADLPDVARNGEFILNVEPKELQELLTMIGLHKDVDDWVSKQITGTPLVS